MRKRPRGETAFWLALAIVAVIALPTSFFLVPPRLVGSNVGTKPEVAKARNDARGTTVQLVAAMVVAIGLVFTARTYLLARQGQLTERFSKAADQLGSSAVAVRLGGIFALSQLAADADTELQHQVREILAAYVRQRAPWPAKPTRSADDPPTTDVQAALTVLGRLTSPPDPIARRLDLSRADLRHADLRGARLDGAVLAESHLEWATLTRASLEGAVLSEAVLDHADLTGANLEKAKFHATKLRGAKLVRTRLKKAEFDGANLSERADLTGAKDADVLPAIKDETTVLPV